MFFHRRVPVLFVLFLTACCARVVDNQDHVTPDLTVVNEALQKQALSAAKGFQGSFLISAGGKLQAGAGVGLANRVSKEKNTLNTSLRLASVTKPITAMAAMRLVEEGTLNLDAPVSKYLPDYGPNGDNVLIEHLLSHSSGIPNYTDTVDVIDSADGLINSFKSLPLKFKPGSQFQYSNSNYALLGYLVARLSGTPYDRHLQDQIFIPLKMENSGFDFPRIPGTGFAAGCGGNPNCEFEDNTTAYASGALYASAADMFALFDALLSGRVVKPESLRLMTTRHVASWGYGFQVDANGWVSHNGEVSGFTSQIHAHPATQTFIVVLANGNAPAWDLAQKLKDLVD